MEGIPDKYMELYEELKGIHGLGFPAPDKVLKDDLNLSLGGQRVFELPWLLENVAIGPGQTILDVGCGTSVFPLYLLKQECEVHGIDQKFQGKLKEYKAYLEERVYPNLGAGENRVEYKSGSIEKLPYKTSGFDVAFAVSVFDVVPYETVVKASKEIARVLKKGGVLGVTMGDIHQYYADHTVAEFFKAIQESSKMRVKGYNKVVGLKKYLNKHPGNKTDIWENKNFGFILEKK